MRKITKNMREVLEASLKQHDSGCAVNKPITVAPADWRARVEAKEFTPSWNTYSLHMFALLDAGIIVRVDNELSCAYVADFQRVREVLAADAF